MVLLDSLLDIYENRGCSYNQKVSIRTKFINKFNLHGERKMMKEEFSILFDDICSEMSIFQRVNETFRELDVNGNGYLDEPEIMDLAEWILSTNRRNGTISEGDRTAMMKKIKKRCNVGVRSRVNLNEVSILLAQVVEVLL
jgi:Ca2+-binding EF-hand superfamily protein